MVRHWGWVVWVYLPVSGVVMAVTWHREWTVTRGKEGQHCYRHGSKRLLSLLSSIYLR